MLSGTSLTYGPPREGDNMFDASAVRALVHATVNDALMSPTIRARCANYAARTVAVTANRPFLVPPP